MEKNLQENQPEVADLQLSKNITKAQVVKLK
jgi:hypothetical protein